MERKSEQVKRKLTKVELRRIRLVGWLCLVTFLSLWWFGSCINGSYPERATITPRGDNNGEVFYKGTSSREGKIQEFSYKGHDYIGFPSLTYGECPVISVVHSPDCINPGCNNQNNKQDEKETSID